VTHRLEQRHGIAATSRQPERHDANPIVGAGDDGRRLLGEHPIDLACQQ
jgi:hypothetical protein